MAFRSERDGGGIFLAPGVRRTRAPVDFVGFLPQWTPDGSQLLFVVRQWPECVARRSSRLSRWSRWPAAQAHPRGRPGEVPEHWPIALHPDGKRITFPGGTATEGGFWTVPLAGGAPTRVTRSPAFLANMKESQFAWIDFKWAPAGDAMFFAECDERRRQPVEGGRRSVDARVGVGARATDHGDWTRRRGRAVAGRQQAGVRDQSETARAWALPFDAASRRVTGEGQPVSRSSNRRRSISLRTDAGWCQPSPAKARTQWNCGRDPSRPARRR